jgi:hypothetical protein
VKSFLLAILVSAGVSIGGSALGQATVDEQKPTIPNTASSAPDPSHALKPGTVVEALRKGGYVIYFRHTATDFSKSDLSMKGYGDCANQRLLSEQGRSTAREIGERIRNLKLPIGEVLASPYCRTMDTAKLAFLRAEPRAEIRENEGGDYPGLKRLLAAPVAAGTNRVIVGHGTPFRSIAGPPHLAEGEAAVIEPEGTRWIVVARVLPEQWAGLKAAP